MSGAKAYAIQNIGNIRAISPDPGCRGDAHYALCLSDGSWYEIVDHGEVHGAKAVAVGPASWVEMAKRFPRITCKEIPGLVIDILLIEPGLVAFPSFKGSLVVVGDSPAKK